MSVGQLAGGRIPSLARRAAGWDPLVVVAAVVIGLIVLLAVFGPLLSPYDPNQLYVGPVSSRPSLAHLMGTDDLGRDILSRVLAGGAASVFAPFAVVVLSTVLGSTVGIASAWFGGWVDAVLTRVIEVIFAIPGLVLAILAVAMFGKGLTAPVIALSIAYLPIASRLVRAGARAELGKPYMAALLPAILAQATIGFGYAMLDLAAISFLGLGAPPPSSDWGVMIASGQPSLLTGAPEQSVFPALLVVLTVLSVNIVGARLIARAEAADS
jgi:ABC-type dipeptide/oligopeptide/nickel transport system permease subunit